MKCVKFLKAGGGRGRPPYDARCESCGVIYNSHPNESRDRYSKSLQNQGICGVAFINAAPVLATIPGTTKVVTPAKA